MKNLIIAMLSILLIFSSCSKEKNKEHNLNCYKILTERTKEITRRFNEGEITADEYLSYFKIYESSYYNCLK